MIDMDSLIFGDIPIGKPRKKTDKEIINEAKRLVVSFMALAQKGNYQSISLARHKAGLDEIYKVLRQSSPL